MADLSIARCVLKPALLDSGCEIAVSGAKRRTQFGVRREGTETDSSISES